jgi:hypothetical protein
LKLEPPPQKLVEKEPPRQQKEETPKMEPIPQQPEAVLVGVDPDIQSLMGELRNYFVWRTRLLNMLSEGKVSQTVFGKLFNEYQCKIEELSQARQEKTNHFDEEFSSTSKEMNKKELELEELEVRHAVGQMDDVNLQEKSPVVQDKIDSFKEQHERACIQLGRLDNLLQGMNLSEILELEDMTKHCQDHLPELAQKGRIAKDMEESILKALDDATKVFDPLLRDKKNEQRNLEDELSALETRHKVGEVSDSDFETSKAQLQRRIGEIWDH